MTTRFMLKYKNNKTDCQSVFFFQMEKIAVRKLDVLMERLYVWKWSSVYPRVNVFPNIGQCSS